MEHMPSARTDQFAEMHAGTAADHYSLGLSHIKHAMKLTIFGSSAGGARPHTGANVEHTGGAEPETDADAIKKHQDAVKGGTNGVFLPVHAWKEIWDLWVLMLILYSAVMVPYRICFSATAVGFMFIFEQTITASFITDVCFNFNTAYFDNEKWVTDRGKISARYLTGWFWIDAPSSFPVELVDYFMEGDSSTLGMLKFLRLFRLLRLLRLLKVRGRNIECFYAATTEAVLHCSHLSQQQRATSFPELSSPRDCSDPIPNPPMPAVRIRRWESTSRRLRSSWT